MNNHRCSFLRHRKCDEPAMLNRTHLDRVVQHHLERVAGADADVGAVEAVANIEVEVEVGGEELD